jgi:hypothetical protein
MSSQPASRKIFFKGDKTRIELYYIMMLQEAASRELMIRPLIRERLYFAVNINVHRGKKLREGKVR